ncbi:F0F1 ATP synthase subunit epsilon [Nocardia noduli]|uniref:F0F1 ATP synthase subunit epsilon n=1 Tax=Nocardia noduli TaxID=2815722 RepID=UPI001C2329CA|nr:hypothetical protein [Nocardia noduli]
MRDIVSRQSAATTTDRRRAAERLAVTLSVPGYRDFTVGVSAVLAPTVHGEYLIEPGHEPCAIALEHGALTLRADDRTWLAAVHTGTLSAQDDELRITADRIEFADRIDVERARWAQADAAERLRHDHGDADAHAALRRANLRLAVAARVRG